MRNIQKVGMMLLATAMVLSSATTYAAGHKDDFLRKGEYLRYQGKIGSVEGGYGYLRINSVSKKKSGTLVRATMKGRTNAFFDKVHRVNNRFWSSFFLSGDKDFRYDQNVDQAGTLQRRKIHFLQNGGKKHGHLKLDIKTRKFNNRKPRYPRIRRNYKVPSNTHSLVQAAYKVRSLPYKKGKEFQFHVFATGRLWFVKARLLKKVTLSTLLGRKKTLYIELQAKRFKRKESYRKIHIWLSDDNQRVPFKIQGVIPYMGFATGELVGYRSHATAPYRKKRRGLRGFLSNF